MNRLRCRGRAMRLKSLRLDIGLFDHPCPGLEIRLGALGETLRRAGDRVEAEHCEALLDVGQPENIDGFAMQERDDLFWRAGGNDDALPVVARDRGIAG